MARPSSAAEAASEKTRWSDYLLPLPQEIEISGEVHIAPDDVDLETAPETSAMVTEAVSELRAAYRAKGGCDPTGGSFTIHVGLLSALESVSDKAAEDAARLQQTSHPEQAYVIRPLGRNGLVVAGLDDRGVFYGIQTLKQLLTAELTEAEAVVPLARITDWPDFEERGLWNSGLKTRAHVPWLAGMKLNFEHINHPVRFGPDEPRCPPLPMDVIEWARTRAFHIMPHCWHYDFWDDSASLSEYYPQLIGQGDSARNPSSVAKPGYHPRARCPCASSPLLEQLLSEWMQSAAEQGIREVSLWLSEYQPCRCTCDKCVQEGSHQLIREARESIRAILEARKRYPDLVGRLFLTFNLADPQEEEACRTCLSLIPTDGSIRVECVYGLQKPFDDYAREGNWVANYGVGVSLGGLGRARGAARLRLYPDPEDLRKRI
ncbi:MAG: glycoside hydrolase family 20 zincin-like fold domain-containing protein, partial [Candidatus Latescibacteria bacterium]|nr:glycoside hydrolase family 20 zincin-like fold domain-containing protein [Candidatus Latescibacterota bacterium]